MLERVIISPKHHKLQENMSFYVAKHRLISLTQEIPAKKKVRNRTFAVRIRTCFRVRISKNSRANQTRASDVPADWTVPGHPKVYVEIGFATKNKVFSVAFNLQAFGKIQLFSVF